MYFGILFMYFGILFMYFGILFYVLWNIILCTLEYYFMYFRVLVNVLFLFNCLSD